MTFLSDEIMQGDDWRALELAVVRLLSHCGWNSVQDVGGSGDKGADILAIRPVSRREGDTYLFQVKAVSGGAYIGVSAINQALQGQGHYGTKIAVVATNGDFTNSALKRRDELHKQGFDVRLWNGVFLRKLLEQWPDYTLSKKDLREEYQEPILQKLIHNYDNGIRKNLFIVATGLGKTVIASTATDLLIKKGLRKVLVLCHSTDLAQQLQREFWTQLPKSIPTRLFMGGEAPVPIDGVSFGLYQTLHGYLGGIDPDAFDLVIVDEAHHAIANAFAICMEHLQSRFLIGMTATPWRGDGVLLDSIFGEPIDRVSLVDGMRMGYLSRVDYRMMCDNINWDEVPRLTKSSLSIRDLNKRLFMPQRDEAVINHILEATEDFERPRIAVFSPSVVHAEEFARKLTLRGIVAANVSTDDRVRRRTILMDFSAGRLTAITSVDVLNEGIDIPDVNMLVFLRATHSRRIFVQQLGRGLRLAIDKEKVIVLDFVTDIRRLAAVVGLDRDAREDHSPDVPETVYLRDGIVSFSDARAQAFVEAWLEDVTTLEETEDAERLAFPQNMT